MKPISRAVRATVHLLPRPGAGHAFHPEEYEVRDPAELARLRAAWPARRPPGEVVCDCCPGTRITLYEAGGQSIASAEPVGPLGPLCDPLDPAGLPARHRARWAAAAPAGLREYAGAWARGEEPAAGSAGAPAAVVFHWLGTVREEPYDAARLIAERAPLRLLAAASTEDLAWAVRETDRTGLDGAVRFFAGEEFTTRHPKRRRVPDTARDLLLRHARDRRPGDLAVLERRLLRVAQDRIRRS
ncbi:hypothetical protein [Streptomyces sp. NPDC029003]|uniref:hypothetical protein n=1 Tax=Streptomyces sp. NPDC029003 TaxID=3155125 RepID=UPI0034014953